MPRFKDDLTVKFVGQAKRRPRVPLGLYTIDTRCLGFGERTGLILRSIIELYGPPAAGKSSMAYYMAGIAGLNWPTKDPQVKICDLETTLDPDYAVVAISQSGFQGTLGGIDYIEVKGKRNPKEIERTHEAMLDDMVDGIMKEEVASVILDSVGMFMPLPEGKKRIGEATVGVRAKDMAILSRKLLNKLLISKNPKLVIAVNHIQHPIGGRGHTTPGGDTLKFAANNRLYMRRKETFKNGAFCAEIKAEKVKEGGAHMYRKGLVAIIPGVGVSRELTAVMDCVDLGLAARGTTVKMPILDHHTGKSRNQSIGYLEKQIIPWAEEGKTEKFAPFFEALMNYEGTLESLESDEWEEAEEDEEDEELDA